MGIKLDGKIVKGEVREERDRSTGKVIYEATLSSDVIVKARSSVEYAGIKREVLGIKDIGGSIVCRLSAYIVY